MLFGFITCFGQESTAESRQAYIDTANHETFKLLGDNDKFYYECDTECKNVTLTVTDKYFKYYNASKSKSSKQTIRNTFFDQYNYLLYSEGFENLTIKIAGLDDETRKLELGRKE